MQPIFPKPAVSRRVIMSCLEGNVVKHNTKKGITKTPIEPYRSNIPTKNLMIKESQLGNQQVNRPKPVNITLMLDQAQKSIQEMKSLKQAMNNDMISRNKGHNSIIEHVQRYRLRKLSGSNSIEDRIKMLKSCIRSNGI